MPRLLSDLPLLSASRDPLGPALRHGTDSLSYGELADAIVGWAAAIRSLGLQKQDRIAVYLPKQFETVISFFGTAFAGCVFVPINPILKPEQVAHILRDCDVRLLVTSAERARSLDAVLPHCPALTFLAIAGDVSRVPVPAQLSVQGWRDLIISAPPKAPHRVIDSDVVSIFYTSGSTGKPKGVVLTHRNMVAGAESVAEYLGNVPEDRILAALPFSFDYGFSQLSTAFLAGASVILMDYLFARDVITLADRERATGLAGVPPLWSQLAELPWPEGPRQNLRYITNSGGAMPLATLSKLRASLPTTKPFLMYGLTEAFRSTYLPPEEVDRRPDSMGRAIPNAEIVVVRPDGSRCEPNEPGELVHRGPLVSLGYWNDPEKTAERFKPVPGQLPGLVLPEMAVWSGDTVRMDDEGFLYFIGRRDEMIKTSGYRVSPTEIEEVAFGTGLVRDVVAVGVPHPALGQAIVMVAAAAPGVIGENAPLLEALRKQLPAFMIPQRIDWRDEIPRNPNGKYDRSGLAFQLRSLFSEARE